MSEAADRRRRTSRILEWVFGLYFIAVGIVHFVVPEGLPEPVAWMYELSESLHYAAGTAEILGGLGLILPGLTGIMTRLTPLAAFGLALVMAGAIIWHAGRGEVLQIAGNVVNGVAVAYIVYAHWGRAPEPDPSPGT